MEGIWAWYRQNENALKWLALGVCLLVVGGGAFGRGLFFQPEFLYVHMVLAVLGLFYLPVIFGKRTFYWDMLDTAAMAMALVYTVSIVTAIRPADALGESMRLWTYVIFYLVLSRCLSNRRKVETFLAGLVVVGTIVSFFGLFTVPGWFTYNGSWTGGVLSSSLQYHNAFAGLLLGMLTLGIYLSLSADKFRVGFGMSLAVEIIAMAFAGSQSRGAYIILLPALLLLFFLLRDEERYAYPLALFEVALGALFWSRFERAASAHSPLPAALWLIGSIVSAGALYGAFWHGRCWLIRVGWVQRSSVRQQDRAHGGPSQRWIMFSLVVIALGILLLLFLRFGGDVLSRVHSINFQDHSVEERIVIYWDSLKLFRMRPLLGWGGGGFAATYRMVQSYLYNSTETHSILFKVMVETGVLGLATFIFVLGAALRELIRLQRMKRAFWGSSLAWLAAGALAATGLHALMDFDMSEGVVALFAWGLLAAIRGLSITALSGLTLRPPSDRGEASGDYISQGVFALSKESTSMTSFIRLERSKGFRRGTNVLLALMAVGLLVLSLSVQRSLKFSSEADQDMKVMNFGLAAQLYQHATTAFPLDDRPWSGLGVATLDIARISNNQSLISQAIADFQKAQTLNSNDPQIASYLTQALVQAGKIEDAWKSAQRLVVLAPLDSNSYKYYAEIGMNKVLYDPGTEQQSKEILQQLAALPTAIQSKVDSLAPIFKRNWINPTKLVALPEVHLTAGEADFLKGDMSAAEQQLQPLVGNKTLGGIARVWLTAMAEKKGDTDLAQKLAEGFNKQARAEVTQVVKLAGRYK